MLSVYPGRKWRCLQVRGRRFAGRYSYQDAERLSNQGKQLNKGQQERSCCEVPYKHYLMHGARSRRVRSKLAQLEVASAETSVTRFFPRRRSSQCRALLPLPQVVSRTVPSERTVTSVFRLRPRR